jgi:DNA-binding response OmpR family regulator
MKTILVVEDNPMIAAALTVRLRAAGYDVLTAADGHKAILSAVSQRPDLIISDIWMPKPIGFLNPDRLQKLGLDEVPVIYITACKKADLPRIAREEGAAAFFEKPFDGKALLKAVADALQQKSFAA